MKRHARKVDGIPVLKLPPARLGPVALALRDHEYDREGFRLAVMDLFSADKEEKSVFRGMAVPTLRALGLMLGFEQELHLSSDGALVALAEDVKSKLPMAQLLAEIEAELDLASPWKRTEQAAATVIEALSELDVTDGSGTGETKRRASRWLTYLEFFGVITLTRGKYIRVKPPKIVTLSPKIFIERLTAAYRSLSPKTIGEPAVAIDELSRAVAVHCFGEGIVITRRAFDRHLQGCLATGSVNVHLHRSMGAGQQLFRWQGDSYESLSIRKGADV